jgi:hypothetical protein
MAKAATEAKRYTADSKNHAHGDDPHQDVVDWELTKDGLPEESTHSGNKALLDEYPENETNSKKTKKTNTGKRKRATPSPSNDEELKTTRAR